MSENITTKENEALPNISVLTSFDDVSKENFIAAIHSALKSGMYSEATRISQEALKCFPEDEEIQKYALVLAPPKVISYKSSAISTGKNQSWIKEHWREYKGQWVALKNGELLGTAQTMKDLINKVGKSKDILMTRLD